MWPMFRKKTAYSTMTKGNDCNYGTENSSEKKEDDTNNNRNRTISSIRTRSARGSPSEENVQMDRTVSRRKSSKRTPVELGIVTRRRKRMSSGNQINLKSDGELEKPDVAKDSSEDVPKVESTTSSSSPQSKLIVKPSKALPTDSPPVSNETKTEPIGTVEMPISKGVAEEERPLSKLDEEERPPSKLDKEQKLTKMDEKEKPSKLSEDGNSSSEDDDEDAKPLSTFLNDSKTISLSKEDPDSDRVVENENFTDIEQDDAIESSHSNEKEYNCDAKKMEEKEEGEDSCVKKEVNIDELPCPPPSQVGLLSSGGDSCDSVDHKRRHDSGSCSASVTSGDGSRTKGRNKEEHRPKIDFRVGAKIEARDCMNMWYPSKIIQVDWDDQEVLIHFERWNSRFDEWVSMESPRLRSVTRTSSRKEKTDHNYRVFKGYRVGEVVLAKWADCKMYPAKILKILPDFSYSVVFYDGFERTVQSINVKKLPPEMIGQVNFKNVPSRSNSSQPIPEKRARTSSSSKSSEAGKLKAYARRSSKDRSERRSSSKTKSTSQTTSNSKGSVAGVSSKKTKLLVGGIFQAKRHKLSVKIGSNFSGHKSDKHSSSSKMKSSKINSKSIHGSKQTKKDTNSSLEAEVFLDSTVDGNSSLDVPRKQFVIEEDHNHFKCPMGSCGKAFRKESLLSSHIKHYHREVTRPTVVPISRNKKKSETGAPKETKVPAKLSAPVIENKASDTCIVTELVIAEQQHLQQNQQNAMKFEGNLDRKMITEKRRQLLLQKRLENVYKKRQQAALMEKNRLELLEKSRLAKRARLSESSSSQAEKPIDVEKHQVEPIVKKTDEVKVALDITGKKKRRRKSFHPFIGERRKRKKKLLEARAKALSQDAKSENINGKGLLVKDALDGNELQQEKRKLDHVLCVSDDESTTTLCSDNEAITDHDKTVLEELTKEFKQFTRNRMAVRTFKEWGESGRQEVVNCRCNLQEEEGLMMQCEVCLSWQHGMCFNIEDESKVPEKYICFACENPRGLRQSFRYRHHQEWFKRGEMASFKFLPKRDNWKLKEDMLRTHNFSSQMIAVNGVLRSLRHKLHLVKDGDTSSLKFWSSPWVTSSSDDSPVDDNSQSPTGDAPQKDALVGDDAMLLNEENGSWSFADHSYSNADRTAEDNRVPPVTQPVLEPCLEPEIEGIQITVSTSSPQHDIAYETEATVKLDPDAACSAPSSANNAVPNKDLNEERDSEPTPPPPQLIDEQNVSMPKLDEIQQSSSITEEATKKPPKLVPTIPNKIDAIESQKDTDKMRKEEKGKPLRNNLKKIVNTKEFSVYECQLNLLDHIEQLQEELDKRMDELSEQLDTLESKYEPPTTTFNDNSDDRLNDMPRVKRLLKGMTVDLNKVRRMSLYSY